MPTNTIEARDAAVPAAQQLIALRSTVLRGWQPPGGGENTAISHVTIHSLDISIALGRPVIASPQAVSAALDQPVSPTVPASAST